LTGYRLSPWRGIPTAREAPVIATFDELNKVDVSIEGPIDSDYLPIPSSSQKYRTQGEDYVSK
jgi:hypothetical protein